MRLMRASDTAGVREMAYRLLVGELPNTSGNTGNGVQFRFRYSVPVFLHPAGELGAPDLRWSLEQRLGKWFLRVSNSGSLHARISDVTLTGAAAQVPVRTGLLGYALAERTRSFPLAQLPVEWQRDSTSVTATANVNGRAVTMPITFAR